MQVQPERIRGYRVAEWASWLLQTVRCEKERSGSDTLWETLATMLEQRTDWAAAMIKQGAVISDGNVTILQAAAQRWRDTVTLSTSKRRDTRELLRSWMRASARRNTYRRNKEQRYKEQKPTTSRGRCGQGMTCSKPARPKWVSKNNYAKADTIGGQTAIITPSMEGGMRNEIRFDTRSAIQRWAEAILATDEREECWKGGSRAQWKLRLSRQVSELDVAFVNLEQLRKSARAGTKIGPWALQNQRIPTVTTTATWGALRVSKGGDFWLRRVDAETGLTLMGCQKTSPLWKAIEGMKASVGLIAVGNGMQIDVATGIARFALSRLSTEGQRVRYADANSGIGFFAEAVRIATEGNMNYVFRAEASAAIAKGHDRAWSHTGVARISSSHLKEDVDRMVAFGQVDIWQISPTCYAISQNNRCSHAARESDTEEMLAQLSSALTYATRARPRAVIIENVAEFTKGTVWKRVRSILPSSHTWQFDVIDPMVHGCSAARKRVWMVGMLHDCTGISPDESGSALCGR